MNIRSPIIKRSNKKLSCRKTSLGELELDDLNIISTPKSSKEDLSMFFVSVDFLLNKYENSNLGCDLKKNHAF